MKTVKKRGFTLLEIMIVVAIIGMLAVIAIPAFAKARTNSAKEVCISDLRQIDSAKEQWAMINCKATGSAVVVSEVNEFLKGNHTPHCPSGGTYSYNAVGTNPTCSVAGHVLP